MSGGGDLEQGGGQRRSTGGACFSDEGYGLGGSEVGGGRRGSSVSERSVVFVAAEEGEAKAAREGTVARECRICQLGLESNGEEFGAPMMDLGCSCKEDLGSAHKHCAEVWFKIKGDKTCEICHSIARNVAGATEVVDTFERSTNEGNASTLVLVPTPASETRSFWHGHRFLNFLLACMVFAFVISWLFHFNVPSN